jgi:hypothetical protein
MTDTTNYLVLEGESGRLTINKPTPVVAGEYTKAYVNNSKSPHSFYLVYRENYYGEDNIGETAVVPSKLTDVLPGKLSEPVNFGFNAHSARGFDMHDPAIYLFEHFSYKGHAKMLRSSDKDLRPTFGYPGDWDGVSSLIVTGGVWNLYGSTDFKPPLLRTVKKGDYISFYSSDNDRVQSVQKIEDF